MDDNYAELLRNKIAELKKELETVTLEKGLAAEENKDLRENSAYDYWDQKESILIIRIHKFMREIEDRSKGQGSKKIAANSKKIKKTVTKKPFEFTPHKWL